MRRRFPDVCLTDAAILQSNRSGISGVIESSLDPIAAQDIVPILPTFIAHQLGHEYPIAGVGSFKPQEDTVGRVINAKLDVFEDGLSQGDYASKRACNCRVQSRIPL